MRLRKSKANSKPEGLCAICCCLLIQNSIIPAASVSYFQLKAATTAAAVN